MQKPKFPGGKEKLHNMCIVHFTNKNVGTSRLVMSKHASKDSNI